jgi:hypothetical protein
MDEFTHTKAKTQQAILTGILWLVTVILGAVSFFAGRRMLMDTYNRFFPTVTKTTSQSGLSLINILVSFPLAMMVIAIIIGGFEYHFRKVGTEDSRWMFARTLAVEIGILLVASYI